jgi:hypothetical protein
MLPPYQPRVNMPETTPSTGRDIIAMLPLGQLRFPSPTEPSPGDFMRSSGRRLFVSDVAFVLAVLKELDVKD